MNEREKITHSIPSLPTASPSRPVQTPAPLPALSLGKNLARSDFHAVPFPGKLKRSNAHEG
jgi:hypothetical protein